MEVKRLSSDWQGALEELADVAREVPGIVDHDSIAQKARLLATDGDDVACSFVQLKTNEVRRLLLHR